MSALEGGALFAERECVIEEAMKQKPTTVKLMTQVGIGQYEEGLLPRINQIDLAIQVAATICNRSAGVN